MTDSINIIKNNNLKNGDIVTIQKTFIGGFVKNCRAVLLHDNSCTENEYYCEEINPTNENQKFWNVNEIEIL
jgi:hypothetical protein